MEYGVIFDLLGAYIETKLGIIEAWRIVIVQNRANNDAIKFHEPLLLTIGDLNKGYLNV